MKENPKFHHFTENGFTPPFHHEGVFLYRRREDLACQNLLENRTAVDFSCTTTHHMNLHVWSVAAFVCRDAGIIPGIEFEKAAQLTLKMNIIKTQKSETSLLVMT